MELVEDGEYFTINRPRQYGKTTTLFLLARRLKASRDFISLKISFESLGTGRYKNPENFIEAFLLQLSRVFIQNDLKESNEILSRKKDIKNFDLLNKLITELITPINKKVVLMIDEVDKSSNNQLFLDFLGMLRDKYLTAAEDEDVTFHSVILAGVHDVKTLKLKLRPGEEEKYNSPWNIAINFDIDLSFSAPEIAGMLEDYSADKNIDMDIPVLSEHIYYYTSGYPFLVSKLCYLIDKQVMKDNCWTPEDIQTGVKALLQDENTNFDSLIKNLENNRDLYALVEKIILEGVRVEYSTDNPVIKQGVTYGIFKKEGGVKIHNRVYEQRIYNYLTVNLHVKSLISTPIDSYNFTDNVLNPDGTLNFEKVLMKFQAFMKEQYSEKDIPFLEQKGRLIFLAFIKPIINGKGFDFKEVQVSEEKRLDIVVTYLNKKYIVELKIWRGQKQHEKGLLQLADYLDRQGCDEGYLVVYDFRGKKSWKQEHVDTGTKKIFIIWV